MPTTDPRIDAYIAKAAPFAQPILKHLRAVAHEAVPEAEEAIKWGMPFFTHHGLLCGLAAFKAHCAFVIPKLLGPGEKSGATGKFARILSIDDLPPREKLIKILRDAAQRASSGGKAKVTRPTPKPLPPIPPALAAALKKNKAASTTFKNFSPSHRREYIEWIADAKGEDTRARRVATTIEWLVEGKSRNWKY